jgi:hypothetical protein
MQSFDRWRVALHGCSVLVCQFLDGNADHFYEYQRSVIYIPFLNAALQ